MKRLLLSFVLIITAFSIQAQGVFKFETEKKNFGTITEGTQATHLFKFTNTGNAPIVLTNVRASCGCTTPEWPKEPILPGESAAIKAIYNSKNRPGSFNKTITITSNASTPVKRLQISGDVVTDPNAIAKQSSQQLSLGVGPKPEISLTEKSYNFGKVQVGTAITKEFTYTNTGQGDLIIKNVFSRCRCVSFQTDRPTLKPGESATLTITYTPKTPTAQTEKIYFASNAPYNTENYISLSGEVVASLAPKSVLQESEGVGFE